jgi:hypothetical protein
MEFISPGGRETIPDTLEASRRAGRIELIGQLDRAIDTGMLDYEKACAALDSYDAGLLRDFMIHQTVARPRLENYGQLTLVEDDLPDIPA